MVKCEVVKGHGQWISVDASGKLAILILQSIWVVFFWVLRGYTQSRWLRKAYAKPTPCCRVAYARDVLSYVPTRTAYAAKCKNLAASSTKPTQTAYAKAVTRRIQEPTRAAYANPTRTHTFHNFAYATFKGVPFLYKSFHLKKKRCSFVTLQSNKAGQSGSATFNLQLASGHASRANYQCDVLVDAFGAADWSSLNSQGCTRVFPLTARP